MYRRLQHLSAKPMRLLSLLFLFPVLLISCGSTQQATPQIVQKATPTPTPTPTPDPTPTPSPDLPARLIITRIGVNAPVEDVGITQSGDLATPQTHPWSTCM